MRRWYEPDYDPYDCFRAFYDPVTAFVAGTTFGIVGQIYGGIQANKAAKRQAKEQERIAEEQYKIYKGRMIGEEGAPGSVEQLHDQEQGAYGSLLSGAAASGVKVEQFERPERMSAEDRIGLREEREELDKFNAMGIAKNGSDRQAQIDDIDKQIADAVPKPEEATDTLEALRNKITTTYSSAEENLYADLDQAKLGLESALFDAEETRRQGEAALWGGILGGGGTLLTGYGMARTPKADGGWGIF